MTLLKPYRSALIIILIASFKRRYLQYPSMTFADQAAEGLFPAEKPSARDFSVLSFACCSLAVDFEVFDRNIESLNL